MRRNLERLANETFDLHVIGGGATGACIARDAARRGLTVALTEKSDFAHATSAHNSKLVHGGLRYLRNFELGLVRESLKERRIWQRIAPHLVRPLPFLVPVEAGLKASATLAAGLTLYDALSFDRGWLADREQRLPGHRRLDRAAALREEPVLAAPGLGGAYRYFDAQMYAPERLALECVLDADNHGAAVANHLETETLLLRNGRIEGAKLRCTLTDQRFDLKTRLTLVAAGPWADLFLAKALGGASSQKLIRSKGIHVIVPAVTGRNALTVATPHGHFFVLPWRGHSLLGTTDTAFAGSPDSVGVGEDEMAAFLALVNAHLPEARLTRDSVRHAYAGLRPLVDDGKGDTYGASRRAELVDHAATDRIDGLISAIGGKWTTSRHLAETAVDLCARKLARTLGRCDTATALLPGGNIGSLATLRATETPDHIARLYGARSDAVMTLANDTALAAPLSQSGDIAAQVVLAVREEMAMTLDDVITRRTGIGQLGKLGTSAIATTAALMAQELGWSDTRTTAEIAAFERVSATPGTAA